ncbi:MAG TPA: hypothetical protein VH595_14545 [Verrucomicrobiae bacterium]|jgi:hypothetical protein|nr:hypothetical protein [Verrucomicrobiae bacterium]
MTLPERLAMIDKLVSDGKPAAEIRPHIATLGEEISALLALNEVNPAGFLAHYEHDARKGSYRHRRQPNLGWFCSNCLCKKPMSVSLVQQLDHGWHCLVCKEWYDDRDNPRPTGRLPGPAHQA